MMTTSYPHNGGMPPQGMQHAHPGMGGPGPNPGQHGMPPGMQHVSGPNGPVSQAGPMMGMQPGMGTNAHALSHLQPQQHMFQQQQQHQMMNPAMMQQRTAQQAFMHRQQQQAMLAHQQRGIGMGFQNPMNLNQAQAQQLQAMRNGQMGQGPFVNLPPHLLQQQQQMGGQHPGGPQQQAAMAQAAQQHAQQQHHQMQAQQQAIAMQHAQSQSSNHSQPGNQGPPQTSQPSQGPLRPPSAIGSHQGQSSPAPQPTPQQQPQPPPPQVQQQQQQQQAQQQAQQQQAQQQAQQQHAQQQAQQQQQQRQQQQSSQPPQSGPGPQQQTPAPAQPPNLPQQANQPAQNQMQQRNPALVQQAQAQAQAQANAAQNQARQMAMMQQKQAQPVSSGQGTLKLLNFVEQIGNFSSTNNNIEWWQAFVDRFFAESGSFVHIVCSPSIERTKQFEIVYAALPRYFYTLFNTDVASLQITLDGATERASGAELKVTCDRAKFIYTYKNSCQVVYQGKLTAFWSGSDKLEWLLFDGLGHEQFIPLNALKQMFVQPSPNQLNPTQSPRMKKKGALQQQRGVEPPEAYLPINKLISASTTDYGLPHGLQAYLEIYEPMNHMTSLMVHYLENPHMKPSEALESWNNNMANAQGGPQGPQHPNQGSQQGPAMQLNMQPGPRPGGPGQPQMFMSPAMQNSLLPNGSMGGSPHFQHTPSPNSQPMMKQQSTSSHTMSVNTSPNMMNNKRRRSTVKMDNDDGGGEMNGGQKVKQSPRVGGNKRMKAGN